LNTLKLRIEAILGIGPRDITQITNFKYYLDYFKMKNSLGVIFLNNGNIMYLCPS